MPQCFSSGAEHAAYYRPRDVSPNTSSLHVHYSKEKMSSQLVTPNREAAIWARLIESQPEELTPETARYLLGLGFGESDRARMQELADRSQAGTLTEEEAAEFDHYLYIGNLLAVMQSKARLALAQIDDPRSRTRV
jgi:hypothetical protein